MEGRARPTRRWEISTSGTCGTVRRSHGQIGISWPVDSSRKYTFGSIADSSEFGMQGYPNIRTVEAWQADGDDSQMFPQSRVSTNHNKAVSLTEVAVLKAGWVRASIGAVSDGEFQVGLTTCLKKLMTDTHSVSKITSFILRSCRQRRWLPLTAFGGVIGKVEAKSTPRERSCGRWVTGRDDLTPDQRLLAVRLLGYCRLLSSTQVSRSNPELLTAADRRPAFFAIARELRPYTVGMARKEIKKTENSVTAALYEITHEVSLF